MQKKSFFLLIVAATMLLSSCTKRTADPMEAKIDSLLALMTIEEKIGQMTQICFSTITLNGTKNLDLDVDNFKEAILQYHVGSFLSGSDSKDKWVQFITAIQKVAVEESRMKIPIIIGIDHVHGANYVNEGTILPHNLNLSCSFDPLWVKKAAEITAIETAPLGLSWNFAPVLDVGKNSYWPRLYETFGEDPLLCSMMGKAFITAYENCEAIKPVKLAACAKHFIGYSDPKSGWDRSPSEIPDQVLYEHFVPPFRAAIEAGVKSCMINSGELNGEPVHASEKILTGLLRHKLGYTGVLLTDIKDIMKIVEMHGGAANEKEATLLSINAGIDMYMACNSYNFCTIMKELLQEKKISEERINISVRRILRLKFELGLFDNPYPTGNIEKIGCEEHRMAAKEMATESIVLLKNNGLLPLQAPKKILLTGFAAHSKKILNGAWTFEWLGAPEERQPANMRTLYDALKAAYDSANISLFDGLPLNRPEKDKFLAAAKKNDVLIVTAGELPYSEFKGNISNLSLDKQHMQLIQLALSTGKPVLLILFEGRPRIITAVADSLDAIIFAGYPGMMGADALTDIIAGKANPSGKLSFSYPAFVGHCVPYYHKKSDKYTALYPFGHGLSYTSYAYANMQVSDTLIKNADTKIEVSIEIKNTGRREGKEVVMLFMQDEVGRITRPVKQLLRFEKVFLPAGITKKIVFEIVPSKDFSYPDEKGNPILENGHFTLIIGNETKRINVEL